MKLLGITGGVGMGKSATARILADHGVAVIDTDHLARQLVEPGEPALAEIAAAFGAGVLGPDGRLRRDVLAQIVFADDGKRRQLESILHPRIRAAWLAQAAQWRAEGRPVGAVVIPLLFETSAGAEFDGVVCVACTPETQKRRLGERGWSEDEIRRRIASQWPIQRKIDSAQRVIWTEPSLDVHAAQLRRILGEMTGAPAVNQAKPLPTSAGAGSGGTRPKIAVSPDATALCRAAAAAFVRIGSDAIQARGCFHVALAGGSTPKGVYNLLATEFSGALPWDKVHLWFGDERSVPPDDPASNYRMVRESLLSSESIRSSAVLHRIEAELDPVTAADRYEAELRRHFEIPSGDRSPESPLHQPPPAQPRFDLILLGMGTDGHTASLFPNTSALDETLRSVVANDVPQLKTRRVTLTFPLLNRARHVVFLTAGSDKAAMLRNVLLGNPDTPDYPCQSVAPSEGTLVWMIDAAAAAMLPATSSHDLLPRGG